MTNQDIHLKYKFETGKYVPDMIHTLRFLDYISDSIDCEDAKDELDEILDYLKWLENEYLTKGV